MLSQPATKIFLRTSEPHAAKWIADSHRRHRNRAAARKPIARARRATELRAGATGRTAGDGERDQRPAGSPRLSEAGQSRRAPERALHRPARERSPAFVERAAIRTRPDRGRGRTPDAAVPTTRLDGGVRSTRGGRARRDSAGVGARHADHLQAAQRRAGPHATTRRNSERPRTTTTRSATRSADSGTGGSPPSGGSSGAVDEAHFQRLADGQHPITGATLVQHQTARTYTNAARRDGHDDGASCRVGCDVLRPEERLAHGARRRRRAGPRGPSSECDGRP